MKRSLACGLACAVAFAHLSPALANSPVATLQGLSGKVMVSEDEGFVAAGAGLALKAGDRILVGEGAQANVAFGACSVTVAAQSLFVVPEKAPCKKGETLAFVESGFIQPTMGSVGSLPPVHMIAFGAAGVVILGVVLLAAGYDEPGPASPNGAAKTP